MAIDFCSFLTLSLLTIAILGSKFSGSALLPIFASMGDITHTGSTCPPWLVPSECYCCALQVKPTRQEVRYLLWTSSVERRSLLSSAIVLTDSKDKSTNSRNMECCGVKCCE